MESFKEYKDGKTSIALHLENMKNVSAMKHSPKLLFIPIFLASIALPLALHADQGDPNTITVSQEGPLEEVIGNWILVKPGNVQVPTERKKNYIASDITPGSYTILIEPPDAASTTVKIFRNGELEQTVERPSITLLMNEGDTVTAQIIYSYKQVGIVSVTSDPPGIGFTLTGPNDYKTAGETPFDLQTAPIGLYSATFAGIEDCVDPKPQSDRLIDDGRINFHITFSCEGMNSNPEYQKQLDYVNVKVGGKTVVFQDVPIDQWFATFVHTAARTGIISGYKDDNGELSGFYGPGDNVTLAQLAKIAHELAGIDETKARGNARNQQAHNQWFEQYYRSAEQNYWVVYRDIRDNPGRFATRAEVVTTLLQALDIPRLWPSGTVFLDVKPDTTKYSAAIETAALDGLVDSSGSFRPEDPVNRAEVAKMVSLAIDLYKENTNSIQPHALDK